MLRREPVLDREQQGKVLDGLEYRRVVFPGLARGGRSFRGGRLRLSRAGASGGLRRFKSRRRDGRDK